MATPLTIDVVSDVVCPWCYLGKKRLEMTLAARRDIAPEIRWRPFFLDPTVPRAGKPRIEYITGKFGGVDKITSAHERLTELGKAAGLDFHFEKIEMQPNTLDAHRLIGWASAEGKADAVVENIFADFFVNGVDLTDRAALAAAAVRAGMLHPAIGLEVLAVRRPDRFRRGGDHLPSLELGYPAIRFTVGIEDYDHQHQDLRIENGRKYGDTVDEMDFPYLSRVTALNVALVRELADAPPAPAHVSIDGAVSSNTTVRWTPVEGAAAYRIYWRRVDRNDWTDSRLVSSDSGSELILPGVIVDDNFFGVSAVSATGEESIVAFGGLPAAR